MQDYILVEALTDIHKMDKTLVLLTITICQFTHVKIVFDIAAPKSQ